MSSILADLSSHYSWAGVGFLTCACAVLSAAVVYILRRAQSADGAQRLRWILTGGTVLGSGIWAIYVLDAAIHQPDVAAGLNVTLLVLAFAAPIVLACAGMWQSVAGPVLWRSFIGGGLFGAAIAAASQIIIAAQAPSETAWSNGFVFASTALGMSLAAAALVIAGDEATKKTNAAAAVLLLLAIMSQQFAEMGLTIVSSDAERISDIDLLSSATLMTFFAIAAMIFVVLALLGARANVEMRERDRRLNLAINAMSRGFLLFDGDENIISCNDRYLEIYGLDKGLIKPGMHLEDLILHRLARGIPVKDPEQYEADFRTIRALRQTSTTQVELADGRTISMINTPLSDGGWLGIHEDITEQLRFETSLKAARAESERAHKRLMEAFEAVPVGLSMLDPDNRYVLWNSHFADIYHDIADMLVPGQRFEDVVRASLARSASDSARGRRAVAGRPSRTARHAGQFTRTANVP